MAVLWKKIYSEQKQKIVCGSFKKGDLFHTVQGMADEYCVSTATSRRVLAELKSDGLIKGIRHIGNVIARDIFESKIYLVLAEGQESAGSNVNPLLIADLFMEMSREISSHGIKVETVSEKKMLNSKNSKDIFIAVYSSSWGNCREIIKHAKGRIIFCNPPFAIENACSVLPDVESGIHRAIDHFVSKGHKRIAYAACRGAPWWHAERMKAYISGLEKNNIPFEPDLVKTANFNSYQDLEEIVDQLIQKTSPVRALLCMNDTAALKILEFCKSWNIKVPEDLAICGCNNINEGSCSTPQLTTIDMFAGRVGAESAKLAFDLISGFNPEKVRKVKPELILRETV
ncbi:MAG: substrate-binding domain-containing protein [Planctomycetota bacterium]